MGTSAMKKKTPRPRARPAAKTAGELNAAQQQAVRHGRSPLLIIAGAGTGKTLTLAHRVARSIEDRVPPERILLLTFTRRAAVEMLHRVETLRGNKSAKKRLEDLRKLRDLAERYKDRGSFLAELTLDPPTSTQDLAGASAPAKDFLVLSTIHSAKGLEWDAVFVINATEGGIPSNRAETPAQLDEERRLLYVALTRARTWLTVTYPRYRSSFQGHWGGWDDLPTLTRFLPAVVRSLFQEVTE
jgi:superfamily I DNA/RNA helicase